MALIRNIIKHKDKELYAYVEYSDENPNHLIILGNKEFPTKEEAIEHAKGFAIDSYESSKPQPKIITPKEVVGDPATDASELPKNQGKRENKNDRNNRNNKRK